MKLTRNMCLVFKKPSMAWSKLHERGTLQWKCSFIYLPSIILRVIFFYSLNCVIIFFLIYVDDLIVTCNDFKLFSTFVVALATILSIKDLNTLDYIFGFEGIPTREGLFLFQHKYIHNILECTNMLHTKDCITSIHTVSSSY